MPDLGYGLASLAGVVFVRTDSSMIRSEKRSKKLFGCLASQTAASMFVM